MARGPRLPLEHLQPLLVEPATCHGPLDFLTLFGNDHPVELEVGFGKGLFLMTAGRAHPAVNYLGIEIERKYQLFTATRVVKQGLTNIRLICTDARTFLPAFIAPGSLQAVHVYFPDPWWKNRHRKRRLFTAEFVAQCVRILRPDGVFHIATDVQDYFQLMSQLLGAQSGLTRLPPPEVTEPPHAPDYITNFERKYRLEGRPIWRADYRRE